MFHVKHTGTVVNDLFTNTEIAENDLQDVLDVHAPGQPSERRGSEAQLLGDQFLAAGVALRQRTIERSDCFLKRLTMPRPRHQGAFCS